MNAGYPFFISAGTSKQSCMVLIAICICSEGTIPLMEAIEQFSANRSTPAFSKDVRSSLTIPYRSPKWGPVMEKVATGKRFSTCIWGAICRMTTLWDRSSVLDRQKTIVPLPFSLRGQVPKKLKYDPNFPNSFRTTPNCPMFPLSLLPCEPYFPSQPQKHFLWP